MSEGDFINGDLAKKINKLTESDLLLLCSNRASNITDGKGTGRVVRDIYDK